MKTPINYQIAHLHLTSAIRQTIIALLGVTFGVSMYVFMNSFMNGVNKTQDDLAFSALAHIRIFNENGDTNQSPAESSCFSPNTIFNVRGRKSIQYSEGIKNTSKIVASLQKQQEITGISLQFNSSVVFRNGSKKINGLLSGIDVVNEDKLFGNAQNVFKGDWFNLISEKSGIILGKNLGEDLAAGLGDNINILTQDGITKNYTVVGLIESSLKDVDKSKAFVNIVSARQLMGKNCDFASDIMANIVDREKAPQIALKIKPFIPYQIESWQTANQQLLAVSQLRSIIAMAVSLTILLVAGFGIYNIMNMTINERIKEIAILKAIGFSGYDIKTIFLAQAAVIGFSGGLIGVGLGYGISLLVHQIPFQIAGLSTLPIHFRALDFILALLFGIATTLLAGYLPSRKASRIDPVTIIRG